MELWIGPHMAFKEYDYGYFMERSSCACKQNASDVPAIKTMLDALANMDFTGITNLPENAKRYSR